MNQDKIKIDARFLHWLKKYDGDVESFIVDEYGVDRLLGVGKEAESVVQEDSGLLI
jgi:hypothetical protein